jgi:hypothetical protein
MAWWDDLASLIGDSGGSGASDWATGIGDTLSRVDATPDYTSGVASLFSGREQSPDITEYLKLFRGSDDSSSGIGGFSPRSDLGYTPTSLFGDSDTITSRLLANAQQADDTPSLWDRANDFAADIQKQTKSPLAQLLVPLATGAISYNQTNKVKKMGQQAEAAKAAARAKYLAATEAAGAPVYKTQGKAAVGRGNWGASSPLAFRGNTIKMATRQGGGYYEPTAKAAEGGSVKDILANMQFAQGGPISIAELIRRATEHTGKFSPSQPAQPPSGGVRAASGGYFEGGTSGQSDKIPAMLSDGEFVMDADTVAALGDGNNAAGASALEKMRQNVRKHKRSAPADKIPPKAKKPEQYLKKGKK